MVNNLIKIKGIVLYAFIYLFFAAIQIGVLYVAAKVLMHVFRG